jgi:hypothetical protein
MLVAGLGFEPRMLLAYETEVLTGHYLRYLVGKKGLEPLAYGF